MDNGFVIYECFWVDSAFSGVPSSVESRVGERRPWMHQPKHNNR